MLAGAMPKRAAASRSMVSMTAEAWLCWSELTSRSSGSFCNSAVSLWRPGVQLVQVRVRQRVLVLRAAGAAADVDVLRRLQKGLHADQPRELGPEPGDHLVGGRLSPASPSASG